MAASKKNWLLQEFSAHTSGLSTIALGKKSGRVMATGGEDGHVNLWAVGNPAYLMKFTGHSSAVQSLAFNWVEELVCAGSHSGQLRIWNLVEGKVMRNLTGHKAAVSCLDFHSLGEFVASGSFDHKVKMWDYRRKGCIFTYTGHEGGINALQFSPDGRWMASAADDNTCKIWDLTAGKLLHQFKDHAAPVTCLQFHPNELLLATGSKDKTVKVYDVEQFHLVSTSKKQATPVIKVAFSESGHCVYSVSQDMLHAYLWEPEPRTTDSLIVKWGRPSDVAISSKQLISASFVQNIVSNHVVDLNLVQTTVFESPSNPEPFRPPTTSQFQLPNNVTSRPPTLCGASASENAQTPRNANAAREHRQHDGVPLPEDPEKVFQPSATLRRSPSGTKPANLPVKPEDYFVAKPKSSPSPHQATNILPHLAGEIPHGQIRQEEPVRDVPAPSVQPVKEPQVKNHDIKPIRKLSPNHDIPTRDDIPEKLNGNEPGKSAFPPPQANVPPDLNESRLSTIVPSQRADAFGLDMNAFLPAKKEPMIDNDIGFSHMSDAQALSDIAKGFESMKIVLTSRYKNLEIVRALWSAGNVMTSMNTAVRMKDPALLVDLLGVLNLKGSLWSLELCQVMLPEISELLCSKFESYVTTACGALKLVLQNFGQVIRSNVTAPPTSAVDLSREERYKKCFACNQSLRQIRTIIEKHQQQPGKVGTRFRELNILMGTLD